MITVTVTDAEGASDFERITLTVVNTDDAPVLAPISNQHAKQGERFTYTAVASDIDDTRLTFFEDSDLFVIHPQTGTISFVPEEGDAGVHIVTITVTDSYGERDSQTMTLEIQEIPEKEETWFERDWMPLTLLVLMSILFLLLCLHILTHMKVLKKESHKKGDEYPESMEREKEGQQEQG